MREEGPHSTPPCRGGGRGGEVPQAQLGSQNEKGAERDADTCE